MHELIIKDYPSSVGKRIQNILCEDYTLTGYYVGDTLIWQLKIYGKTQRTIELLTIAISEYVLDSGNNNSTSSVYDRVDIL